MFCYEDGGVVDDTCICKLEENHYIFTINAANIDKDVEWFKKQTEGFDVVLSHESDYYGQLAIQGPEAEATIEKVLEIACSDLKFYEVKTLEKDGETIIISRTGYTGEDGFELYGSHEYIRRCWDKLIEALRSRLPRHPALRGGSAPLRRRAERQDHPGDGRPEHVREV